ncbi:oligomycin resistance atp-dependent permease yor1 [Acrodontium crateriforme]|uniref:Oligomycin resistance atp-dependent permease yor1 n=1 Tax=Acrodontium crateriforme TaxID=150365 RepID=A0AAQ3RA10_9PEZI|nr:oligomycin resistance atp-dependent permease yor1 [Acrodontium crateriforme]
MSSAVPDAEQTWAADTETAKTTDPRHAEPLADEPLARVASGPEDLNEENHGATEPVEESAESQSEDEKHNNLVKPQPLERTRSNWTTATGTSINTDASDVEQQAPHKRTWGEKLNPLKRKNPPLIPKERATSREFQAGFFSLLIFQWMAPLMSVGYQRPLEVNDVWAVNPNRRMELLADRLRKAFAERKKQKARFTPLVMALYDTFKFEFLLGAACQLTASCLQVLTPFVMKYLIKFAGEAYYASQGKAPVPPIGEGIGLVFGITGMQMIQSMCTNHFIYRGMLVGGQARSVLITVIFDKAMVLSGRAKSGGKATGPQRPPDGIQPGSKEEKEWFKKNMANKSSVSGTGEGWSNGRIVNLMSTDTYRVDQAAGMFHMCWTSPVQVVIVLILLLINLSYSALAGFAFITVMMPLLARAIKSLMSRRKVINKITDQRVSLTQEIIQSVRFVKFFGWETSFLDRLATLRNREISRIAFLLSIRNGIMAVSMTMPIFASMLAFITFRLTNHNLAPAPIFSSLALFNALRIPLNMLPMVIGQIVDANASLARIQEFLNAEEIQDETNWDNDNENAIVILDADFTWERTPTQNSDATVGNGPSDSKLAKAEKKDAKSKAKEEKRKSKLAMADKEKQVSVPGTPSTPTSSGDSVDEEEKPFSVRQIDLAVGRQELIAVIGSVGSGKSSLLGALAGDMRKTNGSVTFGASRAFCPQYAWIQNATVRQNITFGKPFDQKWYDTVVDACALRPDLEMLPAGDATEIGERGITVSGGQKQRLNIARAIYFNADIVLMDDPLSAVDAHVGRHIMDNAICGLLRNKCRVLVTHQLHVLHRVDRIVWMKEGTIHKVATFPELMANDTEFQKLMETTAVEEKHEEPGEVNEDEVEDEKKQVRKRKSNKRAAALMQQEERAVASVSGKVYGAYIRASGSIINGPFILILLILSQGANIMTSLWLSWWTSSKFGFSQSMYIGLYALFGVLQAALMFAFATTLTVLGTKASKIMLRRAITRVLRAPMSFFDTTPLGRITNRFSKDVDTMDNSLTDSIRMFLLTMGMILSVFILIIAYYYYFAIALIPLTFMFLWSTSYYRSSAREIKRHEAVLRSVVFSRFGEAISGTATIRAYGLENQFSASVRDAVDSMDGAYFLTFANQRWLSTRLDAVGNLLVFTCGILVVTSRFSINPSTGGLVLSYILSIVGFIQFTVRQLAEVENNMNSTERLHYYGTELEEEAPLHVGDVRPSWPEKGEIIFDNVQMRYRAGLPLVLKGLSMHVKAGERIGVVGRTGAGKSTIMSTLFRLVELSGGSITVDGVNIAQIGLNDLRSKLAIIPQDPTLFRGTIRSNLDPFNEHNDLELWNALRQADLVGAEQTMEDEAGRIHLDTTVEDEGLNFSLGQRQLLALARALVRGSQIIVCDEATSSVDFETDQKIQKTIVRGFKGKTLLCIAHRLKTIIGYDRILVMDAGNVAELDSPINLYDQGGIFRSMCDRSGIRREDFFNSDEAHFDDASPVLERTQSAALGQR